MQEPESELRPERHYLLRLTGNLIVGDVRGPL